MKTTTTFAMGLIMAVALVGCKKETGYSGDTDKKIKALTLETVSNMVDTAVSRAMEPLQRFLTNPPPLNIVTQFVTIPSPVATVTPAVVTNNTLVIKNINTLVVSSPPPPSQAPKSSDVWDWWTKQ